MRSLRLFSVLLTTKLLVVPSAVAGQSPADRATLNAVLTPSSQLSACEPLESSLRRLCEGLVSVQLAESGTEKVNAQRARDLLERVVTEHPDWSVAWYGLGVARLQVSRAGLLAAADHFNPSASAMKPAPDTP